MPVQNKRKRRKRAIEQIIRRRMAYAAGLGLIPLPVIDVAGIFASQVLMIREITQLYKIPFEKHRVEAILGTLVGNLGTLGVSKIVPGLGSIAGGISLSVSAAAATYAIGKVFTEHFDQGGTLLDFDPEKSREYFKKLYEEGQLKSETASIDNKNQVIRRRFIHGLIIFLPFLLTALFILYLRMGAVKPSIQTEVNLTEQVGKAVKMELVASEILDSVDTRSIASFAPYSTEGVIAEYLDDPESTFPERFTLSAVQFTGASVLMNNNGAERQLYNISLLMKKYPQLIVNIYGHSPDTGPKFNRDRMGRQRARYVKGQLVKMGVQEYRITANYIEKSIGTHFEYWGADIVIDVSEEESLIFTNEE